MDIVNCVKAFFLSIISLVFQFLPNSDPRQPTQPPAGIPTRRPHSPPPSAQDIETPAENSPQPASPVVSGHQNLDWAKIIFAFCFASAVEIAILSVQTKPQLPPAFHLLSLAMSFAFATLFVATFIGVKYPVAAHVLDRIGVFSAATAFFLAITIPFPTSLKCTTWTIYAVSMLAIIICHCT